jgi:hypothetical protein
LNSKDQARIISGMDAVLDSGHLYAFHKSTVTGGFTIIFTLKFTFYQAVFFNHWDRSLPAGFLNNKSL